MASTAWKQEIWDTNSSLQANSWILENSQHEARAFTKALQMELSSVATSPSSEPSSLPSSFSKLLPNSVTSCRLPDQNYTADEKSAYKDKANESFGARSERDYRADTVAMDNKDPLFDRGNLLNRSCRPEFVDSPRISATSSVSELSNGRFLNNPSGGAPKIGKKRARASRKPPTTVLEADSANFRSMVQHLTGIPAPPLLSHGLQYFGTSGSFGGLLAPSYGRSNVGFSRTMNASSNFGLFSAQMEDSLPSSFSDGNLGAKNRVSGIDFQDLSMGSILRSSLDDLGYSDLATLLSNKSDFWDKLEDLRADDICKLKISKHNHRFDADEVEQENQNSMAGIVDSWLSHSDQST